MLGVAPLAALAQKLVWRAYATCGIYAGLERSELLLRRAEQLASRLV